MKENRKYQDFEGKSVEEAIENALQTLNKKREEIEIEVLQEPSSKVKLFGFSLKNYKIRVYYQDENKENKNKVTNKKQAMENTPVEKLSKIGQKAYEFLKMTLEKIELPVKIEKIFEDESVIHFYLSGKPDEETIGKSGIVLESLQVLTYMVGNKNEQNWKRILLNIGDYREKRESDINEFIRDVAHRVKKTKKPFLTRPYSPYERRIIHMIVQEIPGLESVSEGNGLYKRVWIRPK